MPHISKKQNAARAFYFLEAWVGKFAFLPHISAKTVAGATWLTIRMAFSARSALEKSDSYANRAGSIASTYFQKTKRRKGVLFFGGLGRNRTGIQGFAVLCITTLPPGQSVLCNYTKQKKFVIQQKNCNIVWYNIVICYRESLFHEKNIYYFYGDAAGYGLCWWR